MNTLRIAILFATMTFCGIASADTTSVSPLRQFLMINVMIRQQTQNVNVMSDELDRNPNDPDSQLLRNFFATASGGRTDAFQQLDPFMRGLVDQFEHNVARNGVGAVVLSMCGGCLRGQFIVEKDRSKQFIAELEKKRAELLPQAQAEAAQYSPVQNNSSNPNSTSVTDSGAKSGTGSDTGAGSSDGTGTGTGGNSGAGAGGTVPVSSGDGTTPPGNPGSSGTGQTSSAPPPGAAASNSGAGAGGTAPVGSGDGATPPGNPGISGTGQTSSAPPPGAAASNSGAGAGGTAPVGSGDGATPPGNPGISGTGQTSNAPPPGPAAGNSPASKPATVSQEQVNALANAFANLVKQALDGAGPQFAPVSGPSSLPSAAGSTGAGTGGGTGTATGDAGVNQGPDCVNAQKAIADAIQKQNDLALLVAIQLEDPDAVQENPDPYDPNLIIEVAAFKALEKEIPKLKARAKQLCDTPPKTIATVKPAPAPAPPAPPASTPTAGPSCEQLFAANQAAQNAFFPSIHEIPGIDSTQPVYPVSSDYTQSANTLQQQTLLAAWQTAENNLLGPCTIYGTPRTQTPKCPSGSALNPGSAAYVPGTFTSACGDPAPAPTTGSPVVIGGPTYGGAFSLYGGAFPLGFHSNDRVTLSSPGIILRPPSFGQHPSTEPSHSANLPVAHPCHPVIASAVPTSSGIILRPPSFGQHPSTEPSHSTNLPVAHPCHPVIASAVPASTSIKLRPLFPATIPTTETPAMAHQPTPSFPAKLPSPTQSSGNLAPPTGPSFGGIILRPHTYGQQPTTSTGNKQTASLTPSGNHVGTQPNTGHSTRYGQSVGGHSRPRPSRTSFRPVRVAHSFQGARGGGFRSSGGFGGGGGFHGGGRRSDIRLKKDIVQLGRLDNGIGIYRFRYKGSDHEVYVGVMAQEVQNIVPSAVSSDSDGYLRVDYDRLGVKFMTWDEWTARIGAKTQMAQ